MKEKETLGDVVQKFRNFYTELKHQQGEEVLRKWLAAERRQSHSITDPFERGMFQALIADMEVELLGKVSDESLELLRKVMRVSEKHGRTTDD